MSSLVALIAGPYNVALSLAVVVAFLLAFRAGRRADIAAPTWCALLFGAVAAGLIGSTIVSLAGTPLAPGAKSNVGGLAVGVPVALILSWWLGTGAVRTLDLMAVPTLVGLAIGRLGCFFAGCCVGTASTMPWAVHYDGDHVDRHPVQLYEAVGDALLAYTLSRVVRGPGTGVRAGCAVAGYALLRFGTEFLRDGRVPVYGLNPVQWWMLLVVAVVGACWLIGARLGMMPIAVRSLRHRTAMAWRTARTSAFWQRILPRDRVTLLIIGGTLYAWPMLVPGRFTALESTVLQLLALMSVTVAVWTMQRTTVATRLVAPSLGAMLLLQAAPSPEKPRRELLLGGAFFGQEYERVVGRRTETTYDYCAGADRTDTYDTRARRRAQSGWFSLGFRGRRASGVRLEAEGRALLGRDNLQSLSDGPTDGPVARRRTLQAGGVSVAVQHPSLHVRANLIGGVFHAAGDRIETTTGSVQFRAISRAGIFAEARVAEPRLYLSTGEFSYVGAGWQFGSFGPRIAAGFGQGGLVSLHLPLKAIELDASMHTLTGNSVSSSVSPGMSFQVGGRLAIPLP